MKARQHTILAIVALAVLAVLILSLGCSKDDPVSPVIPAPVIDIFTASPNDIIPPDSARITWKSRMADSVKIFPSGQKLNPKDSGQIYVKPSIPTEYKIIAYSGGGRDSAKVSVVMTALAANIVSFRIIPDTVVSGDTSVISWRTTQADSLVINQGIGRVSPTDTGTYTVVLSSTATYRAIAYSVYGNDTNQINVRVRIPTTVRTLGGAIYKGEMGSSTLDPALKFAVADAQSFFIENLWIKLRLLQGDGVIIPADSAKTDSNRLANVSYNFSGQLGHAVISANYKNVDTVDVFLRANTIIPGIGGQGQHILLSEKLADVKIFNGSPGSIEVDPNFWVNYANYDTNFANFNVVFAINDANQDNLAQDSEDVLAILLTSGYPYKTKDSIGIGSTYNQIKTAYGQPDSVIYDPTPPPALKFVYNSLGLVFFTDTVVGSPVDTNVAVFEIHMDDFINRASSNKIALKNALGTANSPVNYRRFRK